jgi:outer membrane receptor protein involved in Fe transport
MEKNIKYAILLLTIFLTSLNLSFAQTKGKIQGIVVDNSTNKPIESVAVRIMKDSSVVKGAATDSEGKFILDNVQFGTYDISISYVGYKDNIIKNLIIDTKNPNIDVGTVKLKSDSYSTEEIKVESEKSAIELTADKKVFDVEKSLPTNGGNAIDVLKKLPSVSVDADGNISLRGSQNVKILLNGKPAGLDGQNRTNILEQIPANQISNVELITNPGAKYEAEGTSGIINIVLKKNDALGYNGNVTLNAGTNDKYYGSLGFNVKKDKLSAYGNYDYRVYNFTDGGSSARDNFLYNTSLIQSNSGTSRNINHYGRGGVDYDFAKDQSLSLSAYYFNWDRRSSESSDYNSFDNLNNVLSQYNSKTLVLGNGYGFNTSLNYTKKFKEPTQILTGDFYFNKNNFDFNTNVRQNITVPSTVNPILQNELLNSGFKEFSGQFDYVHPFSDNTKLETGVKGQYRDNLRDYIFQNFDYNSSSYVNDPTQTNNFDYKEQIYSMYGTFSSQYKGFSFSLGIRGEQTITKGELANSVSNFDRKYSNLFPSASISQKLSTTDQIQVSYSRRINRPQIWALNPFRISLDPSNLFSGNPNLKPELIDSYELSFNKFFATASFTPSIFYRYTHDRIDRTRFLLDSNTTITTFDNFSISKSYGAEMLANATLFKFWNLNGSVSYFKTEVNAENLAPGLTNSGFTWSGRLTSSMYLPNIITLQLSYYYSGKQTVAQGEMAPFQAFDISLKRSFLDNKLDVGLRFSDVFKSQEFKVNINDPSYTEEFIRNFDSRNVYLTFTWKFGAEDKQKNERRRPQNNNQDKPPDGMGF